MEVGSLLLWSAGSRGYRRLQMLQALGGYLGASCVHAGCGLPRTPLSGSSQNAPWTSFRLCEVALLDRRPRPARRRSGALETGCFGTHASALVPTSPSPWTASNEGANSQRFNAYGSSELRRRGMKRSSEEL